MNILDMSLSAGVFIASVIVIRAVFKSRLPKRTFMALWWVAVGRLLFPISIPSQGNIFSLLSVVQSSSGNAPIGDMSNLEIMATAVADWGMGGTTATVANGVSPLALIWVIGALTLAVYFIVVHLKHRTSYTASLPLSNEYIDNWRIAHNVSERVDIRSSDMIDTPLSYGLLKPTIVIPKGQCKDQAELELILTHEYIHIKNLDALTKYALTISLCLHWFNPIVWMMYFMANKDMEIVCDNDVVRKYSQSGVDIRARYASTLLNIEEKRHGFSPLVSALANNSIEERIVSIMKSKKGTMVTIVLAIVVVVGSVVVFATDKQPIKAPEPNGDVISSAAPITPNDEEKLLEDEIPFEVAEADENLPSLSLPITDIKVTNGFGGKVNHMGIDYIADEGTEIYAIADGTVAYSMMIREDNPDVPAYGNYIVIDHGNGYKSLYAHCSKLVAKKGDIVKKGDLIARVGKTGWTTGNHLHLEIRLNGKYLNPEDILPK